MKSMKPSIIKTLSVVIIISILLLSGCTDNISKTITDNTKKVRPLIEDGVDFFTEMLANEIEAVIHGVKSLPILNEKTIDTFDQYQNFADSINTLFKLLNREGGYDFKLLKGTSEEYEKISKIITEYSPLINNYNSVITATKNYDENNPESVKEYYKALGILGLEIAIIYSAMWYSPTYKVVGMVYRWSGLNRFAFKCPTIISFILSKAHWGLRGILVDTSSNIADYFIDGLSSIILIN